MTHSKLSSKALIFLFLITFCSFVVSPSVSAGTLQIQGGNLTLELDDGGGANAGFDSLTRNGGPNLLAEGYFSVAEQAFDFVNDGLSTRDKQGIGGGPPPTPGPDWETVAGQDISAGPTIGSYNMIRAGYNDPQANSTHVTQLAFGDASTSEDFVVVAFKVENTWTGGNLPALLSTIWLDLDAGGVKANSADHDAANNLSYHLDNSGANGDAVGVVLLTGNPSNVIFPDEFVQGDGLVADQGEIQVVTLGNIGGLRSEPDLVTGVTGPAENIPNIGNSFTFALAICAADDLVGLQTAAQAAQNSWTTTLANVVAAYDPYNTTPALAPNIASISPVSASAGDLVSITGTDLNDSQVFIGNIQQNIVARTATNIDFVVVGQSPVGTGQTVATLGSGDADTTNIEIIPAPLAILTTSLPAGLVNTPYSETLTGQGGIPPYTWSVNGLPASLSFNPTTGVISGTPTSNDTGSYQLTITLNDAATPTPNQVNTNLSLGVQSVDPALLFGSGSSGGGCVLEKSGSRVIGIIFLVCSLGLCLASFFLLRKKFKT